MYWYFGNRSWKLNKAKRKLILRFFVESLSVTADCRALDWAHQHIRQGIWIRIPSFSAKGITWMYDGYDYTSVIWTSDCCVLCSTRGGCSYSTARWRWLRGSTWERDDDATETRRSVSLSHHVRHVLRRHRLITASVFGLQLQPAAAAAVTMTGAVVKWSRRHVHHWGVTMQWTSCSWFYTSRCVSKHFCDFASPQATNLSKSSISPEWNGCLSLLFFFSFVNNSRRKKGNTINNSL